MDNQNFEMISKYKEVIQKEIPTGYAKPVDIEPTKKQYELGWMFRYFCRQSNSIKSPIREIDKAQFKSYSNPAAGLDKAFYNVVKVKWLLTGPKNQYTDIYGNDMKGVLLSNNDSAEFANKEFPGIKEYLFANLLKFYKDFT